MSAFSVISTVPNNPSLIEAINRAYGDANIMIAQNVWLIADKGVTTQEVSKKLGIEKGGVDNTVILKIDSYWGMAPTQIWEWLSVKLAET